MAERSSKNEEPEQAAPDSDEHFAFIAGYTEGDCPYGVTCEAHEKIEASAKAFQSKIPVIQGIPVSLNDIVQQMDMLFDELTVYFKRSSGEFILVNDEGLALDDCMEGEQKDDEVLIDENDGDHVELPSKWEIHEYSIIESFCHTVENPMIANDLFRTIYGKGAFRRFKEAICRHSIEEDWYRFRDEAYRKIAQAWCEENGISWREE